MTSPAALNSTGTGNLFRTHGTDGASHHIPIVTKPNPITTLRSDNGTFYVNNAVVNTYPTPALSFPFTSP
jgi:hypothetical protein